MTDDSGTNMTIDNLDLKVLMDMIERYANFAARHDNNGKEYAACFLECVSRACAKRAAAYRIAKA